jgi:hypothetical protein
MTASCSLAQVSSHSSSLILYSSQFPHAHIEQPKLTHVYIFFACTCSCQRNFWCT